MTLDIAESLDTAYCRVVNTLGVFRFSMVVVEVDHEARVLRGESADATEHTVSFDDVVTLQKAGEPKTVADCRCRSCGRIMSYVERNAVPPEELWCDACIFG